MKPEILYPQSKEILSAVRYTIKISAEGANNVRLSADGAGFQQCRPSGGAWYYDWRDIPPGEHTLRAECWNTRGERAESNEICVSLGKPASEDVPQATITTETIPQHPAEPTKEKAQTDFQTEKEKGKGLAARQANPPETQASRDLPSQKEEEIMSLDEEDPQFVEMHKNIANMARAEAWRIQDGSLYAETSRFVYDNEENCLVLKIAAPTYKDWWLARKKEILEATGLAVAELRFEIDASLAEEPAPEAPPKKVRGKRWAALATYEVDKNLIDIPALWNPTDEEQRLGKMVRRLPDDQEGRERNLVVETPPGFSLPSPETMKIIFGAIIAGRIKKSKDAKGRYVVGPREILTFAGYAAGGAAFAEVDEHLERGHRAHITYDGWWDAEKKIPSKVEFYLIPRKETPKDKENETGKYRLAFAEEVEDSMDNYSQRIPMEQYIQLAHKRGRVYNLGLYLLKIAKGRPWFPLNFNNVFFEFENKEEIRKLTPELKRHRRHNFWRDIRKAAKAGGYTASKVSDSLRFTQLAAPHSSPFNTTNRDIQSDIPGV